MSALDDCHHCRLRIDGGSAAVSVSKDGATWYVPFLEDLRATQWSLFHLKCYANVHSLDALLDVIHQHDEKVRRETWDMVQALAERRPRREP